MQSPQGEIYIPDDRGVEEGLRRTTHLAVVAHQDDAEIMAYPGIAACYASPADWFTAVVVTNGGGGPRQGTMAHLSAAEMTARRNAEQKAAARRGRYGALALLGYPSQTVRDPAAEEVVQNLRTILALTRPKIIYTHNPADRHDTHVAVLVRTLEALRGLGSDYSPERVYGCEVWRSLDWLTDDDRVMLDASTDPQLAADLIAVHASQMEGGKRYDLAVLGRRTANATFENAYQGDAPAVIYAMDLTPLAKGIETDLGTFVEARLARLREDVRQRIQRCTGQKR